MLILGIETSTSFGSIALYDSEKGRVRGHLAVDIRAAHSEKLVPYIDFLLRESGIDLHEIGLIGVSIGPGSFTGLRVGLSTAKGLAFSVDKPIVPVDSLMACTYPHFRQDTEHKIAAVFDAKRGEVFGAAYRNCIDGLPECVIEPNIFSIEEFLKICANAGIKDFCGDIYNENIFDSIPSASHLPPKGFELPNAISISILANIYYSVYDMKLSNDLSPKYLRNFVPGKPRL
jgi:tRNA threonylcarbamoyladenosine biosynthesis protein TsaB